MPPDNFAIEWAQFYLTCPHCDTANNPVKVNDTSTAKPCMSCGKLIDLKSPKAVQARDDVLKAAMQKAVKDAGG